MAEGLCNLSIIPVKSEPSGRSTLVNQLLFGDRVEIIEESVNWLKVKSLHDNYEGWCEKNQLHIFTAGNDPNPGFKLIQSLTATFTTTGQTITLLYGSSIDCIDNQYLINGNPAQLTAGETGDAEPLSGENIVKACMPLMNAPYLWGGRSPFGIDCSGLVQVVFKMTGKMMPRDAWQQAEHPGEFIDLIDEAKPGDIAFFDNDEGRIIHTGIITGNGQIIHANGKVREDSVDHYGIFNKDTGKYSHRLRIIKRFC